jgi:general secretion pathway protein A
MKRIAQRILMIAIAGVMGTMGSYAEAGITSFQAEETARLIAALLSTGRVVIDRNQTLIDDPNKGDKGFTPEAFERQVIKEFRARTGVDLTKPTLSHLPSETTNLLRALLEASKEVVAAAQPVINQKGVGYKNFIPATFGSQVAGRFSARSGVQLKQTTLEPRNPKNAPDQYEEAVLRRLLTQPSQSVTISGMETGNKTLRVLTPIYYTKDCLTCHGGPAGEMDISGYRKEGAEEGDLAGAISVSIPLDAVK